jgi:hypothetical protein
MLEQLDVGVVRYCSLVKVVQLRLSCCADRSRVEVEGDADEKRREDEEFRRENRVYILHFSSSVLNESQQAAIAVVAYGICQKV